MSIGSEGASSDSIQVHPGPAAAGSTSSANPASNNDSFPATPSPPPPKAHPSSQPQPPQQQIQQQQKQSTTTTTTTTNPQQPLQPKSQQNQTPSAKSNLPSTPAVTQTLQRPPPPASAVSLHDAAVKAAAAKAANAVTGGAPQSTTPIAPKHPAQSSQSSQQSPASANVSAASNTKTDANAAPKKSSKAKATKAPGSTTKPKQKRRANQASAQDDLVYRPAPSTAGGTIGAAPDSTIPAMLTAAGGGRKALPELVLPFQLPYTDIRPEMPMLDNASVQAAMAMGASETSSLDTGSDSDDYSVMSDDSDLDSEAEENRREARRRRREPATIEESLVLLQSLRQSRLSHLSSLLTPFSQRVRSGMIYPNVLPLSLLHGLNPREPHVLIQLGRADIHVGPHVFMKTKFWEVRPDYELPPAMNPIGAMRGPVSYGGGPSYARLTAPQPLPQQLPQPQTPRLPSPRAMPSMPQPAVPLARPPSASTKPPVVRPGASAVTASSNANTAATSAVSKPATVATPAAMPTPTLPATPVAGPAAARPIVPAKAPVSAPTAASPTFASTPATTAASTSAAAPATATPPTPAVKPVSATCTPTAATAPTPAKPAAVTSTPASGATTPISSNAESKPATTASAPVTLAPKPITMPVSLPRPPMTTPSLPRPPSINQNNIPSSANSAVASSTTATPTAASAPGSVSSSVASAAPKPGAQTTAPSAKPTGSAAATAAPASASSSTSTTATTPAAGSAPQTAPAAGQPSTASKPPANAAPSAGASAAPARPPGPPPPPAIDAVLVSRVNATAALNPELQELLHIAASGKANPNQLKALGVWIQAITAQLRQDEARNAAAANNAAAASGSRTGATASTTADGKKTKKTKVDEAAKASKKQARIEEREAKKKAKAEAKAKAQADKQQAQKQQKEKQQKEKQQMEKQQMLQQQQQMQQQQHQPPVSNKLRHPPPGWPTDGPPKPPVIVVEFRENPSMRFILPLWKCLVERTEGIERPSIPKVKKERRSFFDNDSDDEETQRIEPELKLSFFAPSLGSDAADGSGLRELEEELKRKAAEEAKLNAANAPLTATQGSSSANGTASPTASPEAPDKTEDAAAGKKKKGGAAAGSKKGNKAVKQETTDTSLSSDHSPSKKHEVYPLTWSIKGGVTESLWEAFGRVPGTITLQPVKREPEIELEPDVAEFLVPEIRYHLLDLPMEEIKIQKETTDTFVDLYSQMPDRRFILPRVAPALLPQGLEDHLQDRFAVRPQCIQGRPMVKRKAGARDDDVSFSYEGIGLTVIGPNGVKTEPGATPPKPPKRKRHVATHNPDGSIKSCGACGKTKTPMWRRGPKGPSQLCNACGARWKAGRLVVPEVAPPPIIEAEEDKSKEEEARKEDEAKASMHGSNALVIPQSSGVDDGSYTVMAPSGLVGGAAPFGDHGGNGLFSLASDVASSHMGSGSTSPSPFIRSPIPEDDVMPASVDPSMLSGSIRVGSHRR